MTDLPPKLVPSFEDTPIGSSAEATSERQRRREAEREALVTDTHQREATLLEDTQLLFTHLAAYLKGELSSALHVLINRPLPCRFFFSFNATFPSSS